MNRFEEFPLPSRIFWDLPVRVAKEDSFAQVSQRAVRDLSSLEGKGAGEMVGVRESDFPQFERESSLPRGLHITEKRPGEKMPLFLFLFLFPPFRGFQHLCGEPPFSRPPASQPRALNSGKWRNKLLRQRRGDSATIKKSLQVNASLSLPPAMSTIMISISMVVPVSSTNVHFYTLEKGG